MNKKCYNCFKYYNSIDKVCPNCGHNPASTQREANCLPEATLLKERYVIGTVCGIGGFGITYKAWDNKLTKIVAIKEYFQNGIANRVPGTKEVILSSNSTKTRKEYQFGLERHIKEARIIAKYNSHRNIVNVLDYFEENNTAYIVMEFLDGESLEKYLNRQEGKKADIDYTLKIVSEMCNALKTIHKDGIFHCDVSPNNIQICTNERYKLYDFGAAHFPEDKKRLIIVKNGYAPPEQYSNNCEDGDWLDIYALGATMYRMLTGKRPDESTNRIENDEMKEPVELNPEIPQYINDAIMKAMAVDYHLRFQSIEEFEAVLNKEKKAETVNKTIRKKKTKIIFQIGSALCLMVAGFGLFSFFLNKHQTANRLNPADIEVWYVSDDDSMSEALEKICNEFCKEYPDINIDLVGYESDEYEEKLAQARDSENMPELFQSDIIDTDEYPVIKPESFISGDVAEDCFFLDENMNKFLSDGRIPVGFNASVLYMNTTRCSYDKFTVRDISDIISADGTLCIADNMTDVFDSQFGTASYAPTDTEKFYEGSADLLFADTSCFFDVQSVLPARSRMLTIDSDKVQCRFCDYWSIGDVEDENNEAVALRLLEFMLDENSQDFLYIRRKADALPVNKNAFGEYKSVYSEFELLLSEPERCVFELN